MFGCERRKKLLDVGYYLERLGFENWYLTKGNGKEWDDYIKFMIKKRFQCGEWVL
jgi:hypothetical protein